MFKFKILNKVTLKVGSFIEILDRDVDNYATFKVTRIQYSERLESNRVYGECIYTGNTNFKLNEEAHLFGLEYIQEHIKSKLLKLIKYEPKDI